MGSKWQLVTHAIHDEVDDLILFDGTHKDGPLAQWEQALTTGRRRKLVHHQG